jgi:hypothetical protein
VEPLRVSRTVNTPADSSVETISIAGLRASAALAQAISRPRSCWLQAPTSTRASVATIIAMRVFMPMILGRCPPSAIAISSKVVRP